MTARPRLRQSKFGATNQNMPFKDSSGRAALKASLARAEQREKAKEDAMVPSGSDSDDSALQECACQRPISGAAVVHCPDLAPMDPELHHAMDQDVIVFNENDLLEVRGLIQGAILNANKVKLISFDEDQPIRGGERPMFWTTVAKPGELF